MLLFVRTCRQMLDATPPKPRSPSLSISELVVMISYQKTRNEVIISSNQNSWIGEERISSRMLGDSGRSTEEQRREKYPPQADSINPHAPSIN